MMPIVTHYYSHIWNCYAAKTFIASLTQIEPKILLNRKVLILIMILIIIIVVD